MPTIAEYAYFAGLIDGEGHVAVRRDGHSSNSGILLCMADIPLLEWCLEHFGGTLSENWKNERMARPRKIWGLRRADALIEVLPHVIPHLVLKRREAELLLESCHLSKRRPVGQGREAFLAWQRERATVAAAAHAAMAQRKLST